MIPQYAKYPVFRWPNGDVFTPPDIPKVETRRWTSKRKVEVVAAIRVGFLSEEAALARYRLSSEELRWWMRNHDGYIRVVRTTHLLEYKRGPTILLLTFAGVHATVEVPSRIEFDDITIVRGTKSVLVCDKSVYLSENQYSIFELLFSRRGTVVTTEMLIEALYDPQKLPKTIGGMFKVVIYNLRKKIAQVSDKHYIETIWGRGYRIP